MKRNLRRIYWRLCCVGVVGLSLVSFTPLVIPTGTVDPFVFSLPRTLWSGLLVAFLILVLTFIGVLVHPDGASRSEREQ